MILFPTEENKRIQTNRTQMARIFANDSFHKRLSRKSSANSQKGTKKATMSGYRIRLFFIFSLFFVTFLCSASCPDNERIISFVLFTLRASAYFVCSFRCRAINCVSRRSFRSQTILSDDHTQPKSTHLPNCTPHFPFVFVL